VSRRWYATTAAAIAARDKVAIRSFLDQLQD